MTPDSVLIRPCTTLEEFGRCVELQRLLWNSPERDLVPKEIFVVAQMVGGHVLGAFEGAELIGFTLASPGLRSGQDYLYAHMTGVLPAYQNADVRRRLRLAQREEALAQGFELVEWTFELLAWEDAHFNLESLGVVVRRLEYGYYGHSTIRRLAGFSSARLVAEWWLQTPRVEAILSGQPSQLVPGRPRVSVPVGGGNLRETDQAQAEKVQLEVEGQLASWLEKGYTIVGFDRSRETAGYLLEAPTA
jgi:predicted GNAT superfamily acetyltransferase